ncbi:site-specific recombinase, phage integrase family domain protein [Moritella sp. PE36]|uniref:hypothetical protein n=1 Tax=Moritella sp. PE36 TaxID=58051 RepID=UPI0001568227|nr:hypothetical protein [Moritella sp. PE36]EDM67817.1 site-specific recombinase, phage integrase family domain protein [Moritella sp. PE36]
MSLKLIESIANASTTLSELTKEDLKSVADVSVANGDFRALEVITNSFTNIYDYDEHNPYWLESKFSSFTWHIKLIINKKVIRRVIDWDAVILSNGSKLTSKDNAPLLNAFKYWITATDNPLENGGKINTQSAINATILRVIVLINSLLIHGDIIHLSSQHLSGLNDDFLMDLFVKLGTGGVENGIYDYHNKVRKFLLQKIILISDDDANDFEKKHPFITRSLLDEDKVLRLSIAERIKACCWLDSIGYYLQKSNTKLRGNRTTTLLTGSNSVLFDLLYANQIIPTLTTSLSYIEELKLGDKNQRTEYLVIPNKDISTVLSEQILVVYINTFKLLNVVNGRNEVSKFSPTAMKYISSTRIKEHIKLRINGRTKTLPPKLVFNLIEDCYEFARKYQDAILDSVLLVFKEQTKKNKDKKHVCIDGKQTTRSEHTDWVKNEAITLVHDNLKEMGVEQLYVSRTDSNAFNKRRNNHGLFDLYHVLMGSIQILTGVIMAKRIDELISLKPQGNLSPHLDPSSEKGQKTDYQLTTIVMKSGIGGEHGRHATIKRPIPRSFALLIWKLEQFNQSIIEFGLNKGLLLLFNNLSLNSFTLSSINPNTYSAHLNAVCDYFETPLVKFGDNELRRYYVRQHQLRRFIAMVFFWSKGFDGLDTLRWMLAHTDIEHLYRYISETETGAVLNGVKASYIVEEAQNQKLENIDALADLIAKRYGVAKENISLSTVSEAIEDYDDGYQTIPSIEQLKDQEALESQVIELLDDGLITLEPEFFTVTQGGKKINDFTLTLQVKELD